MLELQTDTSPALCIVAKVLQGKNQLCVCVCEREREREKERERDIYVFSSVKCMNKLKWSCITLIVQVVIRLNLLCKSQYTHNDNIIVEYLSKTIWFSVLYLIHPQSSIYPAKIQEIQRNPRLSLHSRPY